MRSWNSATLFRNLARDCVLVVSHATLPCDPFGGFVLPAVDRMRWTRSALARPTKLEMSGKASAVKNSLMASGLSVSMCCSSCFFDGACPFGVLSCWRRFWVDKMPLVNPAVIIASPSLVTTSFVTLTTFVCAGSLQKNSGIGVPVYFFGSALVEGGTGLRPAPPLPTATISYFTLKSGGRTVVVSRERRSVKSRQLN